MSLKTIICKVTNGMAQPGPLPARRLLKEGWEGPELESLSIPRAQWGQTTPSGSFAPESVNTTVIQTPELK